MILLINNHDSFTFNLFQAIEELGETCVVISRDDIQINLLEGLRPQGLIISPGPGNPDQAPLVTQTIQAFADSTPILGVCLGHQILGTCFGARWGAAKEPTYGKATSVHHQGKRLFQGISQPMMAAKYHSLALSTLPKGFEALAWSDAGELMAIGHGSLPVFGVQFHPESFMTPEGLTLLSHFCELCRG